MIALHRMSARRLLALGLDRLQNRTSDLLGPAKVDVADDRLGDVVRFVVLEIETEQASLVRLAGALQSFTGRATLFACR
jgi:hypothetical protein